MRKRRFYWSWILIFSLTACVSTSTKQHADQEVDLVGGDKDEHGCVASAGYIWSDLLQECIRPFEVGVKMVSEVDSSATSAAFLVFNSDSSKIELFLPDEEEQPILDRSVLPDGSILWTAEDGDVPTVSRSDGSWIIHQNTYTLYREASSDSIRK